MNARIIALLACLGLSGCLLPDGYRAELAIAKDRSYTIRFDGELAYLTGLRDLKAGRADEAAVEAGFAEALTEVSGAVAVERRSAGVHRATITGGGQLQPGVNAIPGPARFLLLELKGDAAVVATPAFTDYQLRQLKGFGRDSRGTLCIRTEAEVLSHNADQTPTQAGGCYLWRLDLLAGGRVEMRLRL